MIADCARCAMRGGASVVDVAARLRQLRHVCAKEECFFVFFFNIQPPPPALARLSCLYTRVWRNPRKAQRPRGYFMGTLK